MNIPDGQIHEPKGASTASSGTVYVSTGSGSGTWKKVDSTTLLGTTGDGGVSGLKVVSNGSNGFSLKSDIVYGTMAITANTNAFTLAAAADSTLSTNSDYALFTGTGAPWASESLNGVTFNTNRLIVPVTGVYRLDFWCDITSFPSNTAKVSVKYRVNGSTFSTRHPVVKSNSAGDAGSLGGFGLISLNANDYIQLYFASSAAGGLIVQDLNTTLSLVKAS